MKYVSRFWCTKLLGQKIEKEELSQRKDVFREIPSTHRLQVGREKLLFLNSFYHYALSLFYFFDKKEESTRLNSVSKC